ncbi:unnamed protein product [Cochlearia groenlandica]
MITLVTILVTFYMFSCVSSTEFKVGGENGWIIPNSTTHGDMFNQWASDNRFKIGDTIRFTYKNDSVLVVSKEEYKKCKATKPKLYSNNNDTVFTLDRSGLFYFISGVSGHCEKGQKMIIKVMEIESSSSSIESPPPTESSSSSSPSSSSSLPVSTRKKSNAMKNTVRFGGFGLVVFMTLFVLV